MELSEYHQWWKHQGGQELRKLLMDLWDPIGVKGATGAVDEYDGYRGGVMKLLRSNAPASEIARYLSQVESERMGLRTGEPSGNMPVANEIVRWYPDSIARWEARTTGPPE